MVKSEEDVLVIPRMYFATDILPRILLLQMLDFHEYFLLKITFLVVSPLSKTFVKKRILFLKEHPWQQHPL